MLDIYSGVDGGHIHRLVGDERDDYLGASSAPAGDVDCDGFNDVLVGLPGAAEPDDWTDGGTVRVYSGRDWSILWERSTSGDFTNYGIGVFGGEDFIGDGVQDWAVIDGRVNSGRGVLELFDGATQGLLWRRHGTGFATLQFLSVFFPGDMNGDAIPDIGYGEISATPNGVTAAGILWILAGAPGYVSTFCDASVNSSGRQARISADGPVSVGNNELGLEVTGAALDTFGLFFYGTQPRQTLFGDGIRCVGGQTQRLFPPIAIDDEGRAYRALDFTLPPVAPGGSSPIEPGATRFFQFWFRDPSGPGNTGFNLSDGLEILFTP